MDARAYSPVLRNSVKTETFSPQNNCATELNVNFLLTAIVPVLVSAQPGKSQITVQFVEGSKWGAILSLHDCKSINVNQAE